MLDKLKDIIVDIARREDLILRRVGKGIFQIPELAFSYMVGRELATNAEYIFGTNKVYWKPENTISNTSGRTDLVFDVEGRSSLAVEFKLGGHPDTYIKDIEKLRKIPTGYEKVFCALIDTWPEQILNDNRVKTVESQKGVQRLCTDQFFDFFATLSEKYKGQLCCIVGVWHIN